MTYAQIGPIAVQFPDQVETNEMLRQQHPGWNIDQIAEKTGINQRYVAAPEETSSDLAVRAAEKLFAQYEVDVGSIDFLLFCTQTPDYPLPTTSCLIQDRLGLPTRCGALDFNLGCSGFVYGLALADGLIQSGVAKNILLLTAETYTKYIDQNDRSLRTIFGDAAAATVINAAAQPSLYGFQFGSDGSGGDMLLVADGGARTPANAIKPRHRKTLEQSLIHGWAEPNQFHGRGDSAAGGRNPGSQRPDRCRYRQVSNAPSNLEDAGSAPAQDGRFPRAVAGGTCRGRQYCLLYSAHFDRSAAKSGSNRCQIG